MTILYISGQCLGCNLVFNIPLVNCDAGVHIYISAFQDCIPHGNALFVSELLSSLFWQFITD